MKIIFTNTKAFKVGHFIRANTWWESYSKLQIAINPLVLIKHIPLDSILTLESHKNTLKIIYRDQDKTCHYNISPCKIKK